MSASADDTGNHFMFEPSFQFETGISHKRIAQYSGSRMTDTACMPTQGSSLPRPDWRNSSCTIGTGDTG